MRSNATRSSKSERGFVLVLTLWVLAAIAIAAAFFGERVQDSLRLATVRQNLAEAQLAFSDGRSEALYRLATSSMTRFGLGDPGREIRLDDRPYAESGGVIQFQDVGGLFYLNAFPEDFMLRFLGSFGVQEDRRSLLMDSLRDYVDADELRRLNGAEAPQYLTAGRTGLPRNQPLQSPRELRDVLGWDQQPALWTRLGILEFVTVNGQAGVNPNTAPRQVLTSITGVTPELAEVIVQRRDVEPINAAWLDRVLGTQYDTLPSPIRTFPAPGVRITQWVPNSPWGHRYNVELTPQGARAPWKLTYFYRLERGSGQNSATPSASNLPANATDPPHLPPRAALPSSAPSFLANQ